MTELLVQFSFNFLCLKIFFFSYNTDISFSGRNGSVVKCNNIPKVQSTVCSLLISRCSETHSVLNVGLYVKENPMLEL